MDIIMHIGFSKCASTTLQNGVFRESRGYLGAGRGIPKHINFGKQFQHHCPLGGRSHFDRAAACDWRDRVLDHLSSKGELENCILSNEVLSSSGPHQPMSIVDVLKEFNQHVWTIGQVKVILVVRNQIDRLGSMYSQFSPSRLNAGQEDFERFVFDCLTGKRATNFLYSNWVSRLYEQLGSDNVKILLLEDSLSLEFWRDLAEFCCLDSLAPDRLLKNSQQRKNVSCRGNQEWTVRPLDVARKSRAVAKHALNRVLSAPRSSGRDHALFKPVFHLVKPMYAIQAWLQERSRSDTIRMNDHLKAAITGFCGADNQKLGELLDRDLGALGYSLS
jgi:hypothetical protein